MHIHIYMYTYLYIYIYGTIILYTTYAMIYCNLASLWRPSSTSTFALLY